MQTHIKTMTNNCLSAYTTFCNQVERMGPSDKGYLYASVCFKLEPVLGTITHLCLKTAPHSSQRKDLIHISSLPPARSVTRCCIDSFY